MGGGGGGEGDGVDPARLVASVEHTRIPLCHTHAHPLQRQIIPSPIPQGRCTHACRQ
jgi:hypothetical protein